MCVCCVATCCDMLGAVGSNLTTFKFEPTTPNMSQHVTTWPNARNMLRPTMLQHVVTGWQGLYSPVNKEPGLEVMSSSNVTAYSKPATLVNLKCQFNLLPFFSPLFSLGFLVFAGFFLSFPKKISTLSSKYFLTLKMTAESHSHKASKRELVSCPSFKHRTIVF